MFPSTFDYVVAGSIEEAIAAKAEGGDETRFLAGGQSLLPMMKIRLAAPAKLVDINRIVGLDDKRQWRHAGNVRYNAGIRSAIHQVPVRSRDCTAEPRPHEGDRGAGPDR